MTKKNLDEAKKAIDDYWRIRNEMQEDREEEMSEGKR